MKILLVDDSSFINLVCRQTLEKQGHQIVGEAYDGEEAVVLAAQRQPDLVIMDIALPKKNGLQATQEILAANPEIKVLAISAIEEDWVKDKALAAGCYDFLEKPFESATLIDKINSVKSDSEELKYG